MKGTRLEMSSARWTVLFAVFFLMSNGIYSVPLQTYTNPEGPNIPRSVDAGPDVVSSDLSGSGIEPGLREGAGEVAPPHPDGCRDQNGVLHMTGSSWNIGCKQFCGCHNTPEGPIQDCNPPRCAIPMISPGCKIVPNPRRNDASGENCCDVVECTPIFCIDYFGGKHEVLTSWREGDLDCFCQYDYQRDVAHPDCQLIQPEIEIQPPAPNRNHYPERIDFNREPLLNETKSTLNGCFDARNNTYSVGETWRPGCETECKCIQKGETTVADCTPFGCPVPMLLPGCKIVPNPMKDIVNGLNCCDVADCPPKLCIGADQILYELNSVWYENNQVCTCVLNYNVNQAMRKCGSMEEIQNLQDNLSS